MIKGDRAMDQRTLEKKQVGEAAANYIENHMTVGLGTGSTVYFTILKLAERIKEENLHIQAVSTSSGTTKLATSLGINVLDVNNVTKVDLTIDGCDEFDSHLSGIKGGGGALLFEKVVATISDINIWVADSSKAVERLGAFPLPVEVLPYGSTHTFNKMQAKGLNPVFRKAEDGTPYITDSGNFIIDLKMGAIENAEELSIWLNALPGVVENGLFINIANAVLLASGEGVKVIKRNP
jgi:ribose 5-phosphate isomerase A